jgi:endonuclease G
MYKKGKQMFKQLLAGLVLWAVMLGSVIANPIDDRCPQFTAYGAPQANFSATTQFLCRTNYAVIHSCVAKSPIAVMERVTVASITGPAKRRDDFREDPEVTPECRSRLPDYVGQPYDRGHMAPGANNTQNEKIMSESFLMSNMVAQVPNNNRGIWKQLETSVREQVTSTGQELYVISGGIYEAGFQTIGPGRVGVPTKLYKIIINKNTGKVTAFLFPNTALPVADLPKYMTTVEAVEQASGLKFKTK